MSSRLPPSSSADGHWNYSDSKYVGDHREGQLIAVFGVLLIMSDTEPSPDMLILPTLPCCVFRDKEHCWTLHHSR